MRKVIADSLVSSIIGSIFIIIIGLFAGWANEPVGRIAIFGPFFDKDGSHITTLQIVNNSEEKIENIIMLIETENINKLTLTPSDNLDNSSLSSENTFEKLFTIPVIYPGIKYKYLLRSQQPVSSDSISFPNAKAKNIRVSKDINEIKTAFDILKSLLPQVVIYIIMAIILNIIVNKNQEKNILDP